MSETVLKATNIKKKFGKHQVLKGINLEIFKGEVIGIIGRSGSGKTTLLHSLIGFSQPDVGEVEILVEPTHRALGQPTYKNVYRHMRAAKRVYGFASQIPSFYDDLTVRENLEYFGELYQLPRKIIRTNAEILLHLMDLTPSQKVLGRNLSGGMERRLDIALALMHDPAVLILDEPTADLDPVLRNHIYDLIKRINAKNTTIILASHHLSELQDLCHKIAILKEGKVLAFGPPEEIQDRFSKSAHIHLKTKEKKYTKIVDRLKGKYIEDIKVGHEELIIYTNQTEEGIRQVLKVVEDAKDSVESLHAAKPSLDEIFVSINEVAK